MHLWNLSLQFVVTGVKAKLTASTNSRRTEAVGFVIVVEPTFPKDSELFLRSSPNISLQEAPNTYTIPVLLVILFLTHFDFRRVKYPLRKLRCRQPEICYVFT